MQNSKLRSYGEWYREEVHSDEGTALQKAAYLKIPDRLSMARAITESQKPSLKWAKYCGRRNGFKKNYVGVTANLFSNDFSAVFLQCLHTTKKAVSARECRSTARRAGSPWGSLTQQHSSIGWIITHYPASNTAKRGDSMMWKMIGIHYLKTFLEDCFTCCFICTETDCKSAQVLLQKWGKKKFLQELVQKHYKP